MGDSAPEYRNNQVIFDKTTRELIVAAYDSGVLVVHGWTVSIGLDDVRTYVADFGRNAMPDVHRGFFFHEGNFVISHQGAKLTLTANEGTAVVKFMACPAHQVQRRAFFLRCRCMDWHGCAGSRCQIDAHLARDGYRPDFPALALKPNQPKPSELLE